MTDIEIKERIKRMSESLERINVWTHEGNYPSVREELSSLAQMTSVLRDSLTGMKKEATPMRHALAGEINKARVTNQYAHGHECPKCHAQYVCTDSVPVWDQEDTDCRWHVYLTCPKCRRQA